MSTSALSIAMQGNQNRSAARPFSDTLRTVLYSDKRRRMNSIVHALVSKAEEGDLVAIKEVADRIEGKVSSQDDSGSLKIVVIRSLDQPGLPAIEAEIVHNNQDDRQDMDSIIEDSTVGTLEPPTMAQDTRSKLDRIKAKDELKYARVQARKRRKQGAGGT